MGKKIVFRGLDGRIISKAKWESLLLKGDVKVTDTIVESKSYRSKGKVKSKTQIKRLVFTDAYLKAENKPRFTLEKIVDENGREWFLSYDGKPTKYNREQQIDILREHYDFVNYTVIKKPSRREYNLVSYVQ